MGREVGALSWLCRYDALLRARAEESKRDELVRQIMTAKASEDILPPSFQLTRAPDPLGRRKRAVLPTLVPREEAPEIDPPSRRFEPKSYEPLVFARANVVVPRARHTDAELDAPPSLPELASAAESAWSSAPPPALVDDAATDPMAVPPTFTRPPPRITVLGESFDETTEPLDMSFALEGEITIDLSPLGLSPLGVSPNGHSPVARSQRLVLSPPAPTLGPLELSPPPLEAFRRMPIVRSSRLELTPPSMPPGVVTSNPSDPREAPAPVPPLVARAEPVPLPTFELKNPWAGYDAAAAAPPPTRHPLRENVARLRPILRTLGLVLAAATVGISVRGALAVRGAASDARVIVAREPPAAAELPPAASPNAAPSPASPDGAASATKLQGTLEITAPPDVLVVVDGIERGRGPKLTLPLGTGYHMVRVGSGAAQLVQIRAKQTSTIDATGKADDAHAQTR